MMKEERHRQKKILRVFNHIKQLKGLFITISEKGYYSYHSSSSSL